MKENIFSIRLKKAMQLRGLRQIDLATKSGLNKTMINKYLKCVCEPKRKNLFSIAKVLEVSPAWLIGYDEEI